MSDPVQYATKAITTVALVASNAGAWWQSFNFGAAVTAGTAGGVAGIALVCKAITDISKAKTEARANSERSEMAIRAERERFEATSFQGQIAHLQSRTEDVNKKLHDMQSRLTTEAMLHSEETDQFRQQIALLTTHLGETYREISALREEERRLLSLVAIRQGQQDVEISRNAQAIVEVANQAGVPGAAQPEHPTNAEQH